MSWENDFQRVKNDTAKELGDLITELATAWSVLGHLNFLKAAVSSLEPQTVAEIASKGGENEKTTKGRCRVFITSKWLTKTQKAGQDAYFIDLANFLPDRTERLFDSPRRVAEFRALVTRAEELEKTAPEERFKKELAAMKRALEGIIPPLEKRAREMEG